MDREVWIAQEATITIHEEDGSGNYITPAILEDKFLQDAECREVLEVKEEGQPGAAEKDVDTFPAGFEVRIRELYYRKGVQVQPFRDRTKRYRISIQFTNRYYSGTAPEENDPHVYRNAAVTEWSIAWQDNDIVARRMNFKAERME